MFTARDLATIAAWLWLGGYLWYTALSTWNLSMNRDWVRDRRALLTVPAVGALGVGAGWAALAGVLPWQVLVIVAATLGVWGWALAAWTRERRKLTL